MTLPRPVRAAAVRFPRFPAANLNHPSFSPGFPTRIPALSAKPPGNRLFFAYGSGSLHPQRHPRRAGLPERPAAPNVPQQKSSTNDARIPFPAARFRIESAGMPAGPPCRDPAEAPGGRFCGGVRGRGICLRAYSRRPVAEIRREPAFSAPAPSHAAPSAFPGGRRRAASRGSRTIYHGCRRRHPLIVPARTPAGKRREPRRGQGHPGRAECSLA